MITGTAQPHTSVEAQTIADIRGAVLTARVRPGVRWSDVIAAAEPYGLAPMSGDTPSVGVVGYTFGGGFGWLARTYGYAADNLIRAELVTADGRLVTASADQHPDLFWAIRGGSGNFGIATELEFRLAPVSRVTWGTAHVPIKRAVEALRWYADTVHRLPDQLTLAPRLVRNVPGQDGPVLAVGMVAVGDQTETAHALQEIRPMIGDLADAALQQTAYAQIGLPGTRPRGFEMYRELSDELIKTAVDSVIADGGANALEFRHWGGATARPAPDAGPVGHRQVPFSIKMDAEPEVVSELAESATGTAYLNFLSDPTRTRSAYRVRDYYRLREVKRRWDPDNVFRINHNIPPA